MQRAYALLGLAFLVLLMGTWLIIGRTAKPDTEVTTPSTTMDLLNTFFIRSSAFKPGGIVPTRYTCDGEDINPPLSIAGKPVGTKSFALIMDDPDLSAAAKERLGISAYNHWVVFNLSPFTGDVSEGEVPPGAIVGKNSSGDSAYTGPCPPDREHRYFFRLYALDILLDLGPEAKKEELLRAMEGHVLGEAQLMGTYNRKQ